MSVESSDLRELNDYERKLLDRLLEIPFPGSGEVREQVGTAKVHQIDEYGSLAFTVTQTVPAHTVQSVPVEAEYFDTDGIPVWVLLHVWSGVVRELEICRADGSPLQSRADINRLEPKSVDYSKIVDRARSKHHPPQ
jgi:hypothetical protein